MQHSTGRFAAYGFAFDVPLPFGVAAPPAWELVAVERHPGRPCPIEGVVHIGGDRAVLRAPEGWLELVDGPAPVVRCFGEAITDDALVHPYLALPAAVLNHWRGDVSLHAAAVVVGGAAVGLLAAKEGGKSTTAAAAAAAGFPVLCDDVLVVRAGRALAGPRAVDLRADAAARAGAPRLGRIGSRDRWRVRLPDVPAEVPLGALVELAWGDEVAVQRLPVDERLDLLVRSVALGADRAHAERLLDLLAVPAYRIVRPADPASVPAVVDALASLGG